MALLDKKLYLADLEARLNVFVPANDVRRIIEQAADALLAYDVTTLPQDGSVPDAGDEPYQPRNANSRGRRGAGPR